MAIPKPAAPKATAEPCAALLRLVMSIADDNGPDLAAYANAERLSAPERRVLQGLVVGHAPAALAAQLGVSLKGVRRHTAALRRKTGYATVAELVMAIGRMPPLPWIGDGKR